MASLSVFARGKTIHLVALAVAIATLFFFCAPAAHAQEMATLNAGCTTTVMWTVGDADTVATVNILLIGAGGDTLATLAAATANDGQETVEVPCIEADTLLARVRVVAILANPFNFLDEPVVVVSAPPSITIQATGGPVDENCERVVEFSATIEDDCGATVGGLDAVVMLESDNATLSAITLDTTVTDDNIVLSGSFTVSALMGSPAVVTIAITAADNCGNVATVSDTVEVVDDTPPAVACPEDVTVECSGTGGTPADDPQLAEFFAAFAADDNCDENPTLDNDAPELFLLGATTVTFSATDASGNVGECTAIVNVVDTTPPTIDLHLNRYALWPPNHKFHEIIASVDVDDICDPEPTFVLATAMSDEAANGKGDGNTSPDVHGADLGSADLTFELRAERSGQGDGRVYTIIYTASDLSGNTASDTATVIVPHDQSGKAKSSNGYDRLGTGFDTAAGRFAIIVPSDPTGAFDPTAADMRHAQIGNAKGVVSPEAVYQGDVDGDGRNDIVLVYPTSMTQELHLWAKGHQDQTTLHYSDGRSHWVVYDIFGLGTPVPVDVSALQLLDDGSTDDSGDVDDDDGDDTDDSGDDGTVTDDGGDNGDTDSGSETAKPAMRLAARPNPFNPTTTVTYELASTGLVSVRVYDIKGRLVRTLVSRSVSAGEYQVTWDGINENGDSVASGVYFIRMETADAGITKKIVMVK